MNPTETVLAILLAALATAVALDALEVPAILLHSSVAQAFLLIMTLVLFAYSPVVGIAAVALFTIMVFKRNVQKTYQYAQVAQQFARDSAEQQEYQEMPHVAVTQPREYNAHQEYKSVPEGFVESYASPEEVGTYPLGARPSVEPTKSFTAMYRPAEDMGENTFTPTPSALEKQSQSFAY